MFFTYILETNDGRYYIGSTQNIKERIASHNNGKCKFTKSRLPVKLVYTKSFSSRAEAVRFEKKLKSYKNKEILDKIIKYGPVV